MNRVELTFPMKIMTPGCQYGWFIVMVGFISLAIPLKLHAAASQPAGLVLSDGRQSITLPRPVEMSETALSSPDRRILRNDTGTITATFSLLPPDQSTDPAAAATMVQTSQGAMRQAMGDNLLTPPESQPDPRFALVMHWRYRVSAQQTVDATRRWIKAGALAIQCDLTVQSSDAATIKAANEAVIAVLLHAPGVMAEREHAETAGRETLVDGITYTPPPNFQDIGSAQAGRGHDYVSSDQASEILLTVLPARTTLDSASGGNLLTETARDLAGQSLLAGPELINDSTATVAIHWSFNQNGKPAQGFRLYRKVGKHVVRCQLTTTGDEKAMRQVAEQTLLGMKPPASEAEAPAEASTKPSVPTTRPEPVMDDAHKAAALLAMADNYAAAGHMDIALLKYQDVVQRYPQTPSAAAAKKRLAELGKAKP